jgi:hypothetical protein
MIALWLACSRGLTLHAGRLVSRQPARSGRPHSDDGTPSLRRIVIIGHQLVNAD